MRDFIGHEALINNFKQRCLKNTLSHAHLIAGEDGVGKGKLANILAKFILNGDLDREYVDIINYSSEKSSFGVDDVRDIIEEVYKKPFEKDKKVIIILDTIKSRCEIYKLKPLTKSELYEYIKIKKFNYDENEIKSAIAFSEGVPGRIDRYFNDDKLRELRNNIVILIKNLNKNDLEAILQQEESFSNLKNDKEEVLNIFGLFIRDILINKEIENEEFIINSDKLEDIKELTKEMSFKKLNNMIKTIEEARRNIKSNVSWGMMLRVMLIGFMEG